MNLMQLFRQLTCRHRELDTEIYITNEKVLHWYGGGPSVGWVSHCRHCRKLMHPPLGELRKDEYDDLMERAKKLPIGAQVKVQRPF